MSDPAVSLDAALKIIEILSIMGGGAIVVYKFGRMSEKVEAAITSQGNNIVALQLDVRELNKLMTSVSVQKERLDHQDGRLERAERLIEDMRRGEGYILPLGRALGAKPSKAE